MANHNQKCGLVLEGGGLRGMFTSGVLDTLINNDIQLDATVGVSSGVLFGCNYKSLQSRRALRYNIKYRNDHRYMGMHSFLTTGNWVNPVFAYRTIPLELDPFDFKTFYKNPMKFYVVCTDIERGIPVYHEIIDARFDNGLKWMQASASMPIFARPVEIHDMKLLDGGIVDSIPLAFMHSIGYKKNIVILTRPYGYKKSPTHISLLINAFHKRYPELTKLMTVRHEMYNEQLQYVEGHESKGNTLVIRPERNINIGRLTLNKTKMLDAYEMGREIGQKRLHDIKCFLSGTVS